MRKTLTLVSLFSFCVLIFSGFVLNTSTTTVAPKYKMSKKVDAIVQGKCYGCHSASGKAEKAKAKLKWDDLASLPAADLKKKMESIGMVVEKGAMPPARMVENNPDMKLTDKETKALKKWAAKFSK